MLMQKNINKIIESNIEIQDKCSYWFNTDNKVLYRYNPTTEKWEPIDMSEAASQGILDEAIQVSVNTSNTYSDEKNNLLEEKLIKYLSTKQRKPSRTCRWARRGHIDEDNLNGVDFILIPCRMKCQYIMITNKYLKSLSESKKISQICGVEDINKGPGTRQAFYKHIASLYKNWRGNKPTPKTIIRKLSRWLAEENTILNNDDLIYNNLPIQYHDSKKLEKLYFATKQIITNKPRLRSIPVDGGEGNPGKYVHHKITSGENRMFLCEYFNTRGVNQFFYAKFWGYSQYPLIGMEKYRLTKVPYMIFKNPFKGKVGGVIPVINGKIRLDLARTLKNETLYLVSTGETLEFDREGICKNPLRKGRMEMFTAKSYLSRTVGGHPYHTFSMSEEQMLKLKEGIESINGTVHLYWYPMYNPSDYKIISGQYPGSAIPFNANLVDYDSSRANSFMKFQYVVNYDYYNSKQIHYYLKKYIISDFNPSNLNLFPSRPNISIVGYRANNSNIWSIGYGDWNVEYNRSLDYKGSYILNPGNKNRYYPSVIHRRGIMALHNMLYARRKNQDQWRTRAYFRYGTFRRCNKTISQLLSMVGKHLSLKILSNLSGKYDLSLCDSPILQSRTGRSSATTRAFFEDYTDYMLNNRPLAFLLGYKDCFSKYQVNKYSKIYQGRFYPYIRYPNANILQESYNIRLYISDIKKASQFLFSSSITKLLKMNPSLFRVKWVIDNKQYKFSVGEG